MKKLLFCRKCLCAALNRIPLVDKCLLVFFLVLLTQSAYSLFSHNGTGSEIEHIDVIVRTSSAAIFGYILSANFILQAEGKSRQTKIRPEHPDNGDEHFSSQSVPSYDSAEDAGPGFELEKELVETGNAENDDSESLPAEFLTGRLQILIATFIGLFCLITLILLRNVNALNSDLLSSSSVAATTAQFRDFVSGCVGFLIGCPTEKQS